MPRKGSCWVYKEQLHKTKTKIKGVLKMKQRIQGIIIGFLVAALVFGSITTVMATATAKKIDVYYDNYKIYINGTLFESKDKNGPIEPFSYNGWIYAPFEHIAKALGKSVTWDGKTNSLYITDAAKPAGPVPTTPTTETKAFEGRLDKNDSVNTYDFTLPYASRITMDFEHKFIDSSDKYWNIQFISKKYDEKIFEFSSTGKNVKTSGDNAIYLPAGEYYIKISSSYNYFFSNFDYTLTLNYEKNIGQFETEKNNTMETANNISLDKSIIANIFPQEDTDYFKFTVDKKIDVYFYFEHKFIDSESRYWTIQLYDKSTTKKQEFYIKGNQVTTSSDKITLEPGEYYIKISSSYNYFFSNFDYTLTVKTQ